MAYVMGDLRTLPITKEMRGKFRCYPNKIKVLYALKNGKPKTGYALGRIIGDMQGPFYKGLNELVSTGLLEKVGEEFRITKEGLVMINSIVDKLL